MIEFIYTFYRTILKIHCSFFHFRMDQWFWIFEKCPWSFQIMDCHGSISKNKRTYIKLHWPWKYSENLQSKEKRIVNNDASWIVTFARCWRVIHGIRIVKLVCLVSHSKLKELMALKSRCEKWNYWMRKLEHRFTNSIVWFS